jgi:hypothetical protein
MGRVCYTLIYKAKDKDKDMVKVFLVYLRYG